MNGRKIARFVVLALWLLPVIEAHGDVNASTPSSRPGRAAAHAALDERAHVPPNPPQLPMATATPLHRPAADAKDGKRHEASARARSQADMHTAEAARAEHVDAANGAAQSAVAAAARAANADGHAAAGQARASAARAKAVGHGASPHALP
jgi:hypothetical protein